jgi:hypothetical protein
MGGAIVGAIIGFALGFYIPYANHRAGRGTPSRPGNAAPIPGVGCFLAAVLATVGFVIGYAIT